MTSNKPYLIRAFYEWIIDNELTPYVVVDAEMPGVEVPTQYVEAGKIILNISPTAAHHLLINNEAIQFNARFAGIPRRVIAPIYAVIAIYARENGRGMVFSEDEQDQLPQTQAPEISIKPKAKKPKLTVIKNERKNDKE